MVRRSDGRWQERVVVDGKAKYIYGSSKAEVTRKVNEFLSSLEKRYRFSSIAEDWREEHYKTLAASTIPGYNAAYKRAVEYFGDTLIDAITPQNVMAFLHEIKQLGLTSKTILTYKMVLSLIFQYAIVSGYVKSSPVDHIKVPKGKDSVQRTIPTNKDVQKVLDDGWMLPIFLLYTGCRLGEAIALTYDDIDFTNRTIRINKSMTFVGNFPQIKSTKTKNSVRTIPLLDELAALLPKGSGYVFTYNGMPFHKDRLRKEWDAWRKRNDTHITAHQLRHLFATYCHDAGLDARDAMALLGHSDIQTTLNIYTHIDTVRQHEISDKLNKFTKKKRVF